LTRLLVYFSVNEDSVDNKGGQELDKAGAMNEPEESLPVKRCALRHARRLFSPQVRSANSALYSALDRPRAILRVVSSYA
jgi:hypothetical protein